MPRCRSQSMEDLHVTKVRVLLADDHVLFRKGIAALLAGHQDVEVVGEAEDGREAVDKAIALTPDVVLMDIHMPVCDGVTATKLIAEKLPLCKVLMLTVSDEEPSLFDAVKAGAHGYLLKNVRPEVLSESIKNIVRGEAPLSGTVAARLLSEFAKAWPGAVEPPPDARLSSREHEILALVVSGASNREISRQLVITEGTVKNHLHNILDKLHVRNRAEATAYAVREGLVATGKPKDVDGSR